MYSVDVPPSAASLRGCRLKRLAVRRGPCRSRSPPLGEPSSPPHPPTCQRRRPRASTQFFLFLVLKPSERSGSVFAQVRVRPGIGPIDFRYRSQGGQPLG